MKVNRLTFLVLFMALFTASVAWCDVVADLMANDANIETTAGTDAGVALKMRESELFDKLLASPEDMQRFVETAGASGSDMLGRFYDRVRFEAAHERRGDLGAMLEGWHGEDDLSQIDRSLKKVAMIYGCEVNLLDGEWRKASDGRRFWVSNEYPDIVLSAAEYKKYLNSATPVED